MSKKKTKREKHIPMRMCIVTRIRKPKNDLLRLVRIDDEVIVDPKGKLRGRGANITMDLKIFDQAAKKHLIERALQLEKRLTTEEISKLRDNFEKAIEEKKFRRGSRAVTIKISKDKYRKVFKEDILASKK